ncbi:unnamed protein product [Caenorhabditis bovis]|uniref:Uncharacterized protein n=1 Tax=Caenorhabditis bovis TaxID=2654633 RepID=A0A8S1FFU0_9PELO|nr:unnamed protein product [Caenorhabditis bovis]
MAGKYRQKGAKKMARQQNVYSVHILLGLDDLKLVDAPIKEIVPLFVQSAQKSVFVIAKMLDTMELNMRSVDDGVLDVNYLLYVCRDLNIAMENLFVVSYQLEELKLLFDQYGGDKQIPRKARCMSRVQQLEWPSHEEQSILERENLPSFYDLYALFQKFFKMGVKNVSLVVKQAASFYPEIEQAAIKEDAKKKKVYKLINSFWYYSPMKSHEVLKIKTSSISIERAEGMALSLKPKLMKRLCTVKKNVEVVVDMVLEMDETPCDETYELVHAACQVAQKAIKKIMPYCEQAFELEVQIKKNTDFIPYDARRRSKPFGTIVFKDVPKDLCNGKDEQKHKMHKLLAYEVLKIALEVIEHSFGAIDVLKELQEAKESNDNGNEDANSNMNTEDASTSEYEKWLELQGDIIELQEDQEAIFYLERKECLKTTTIGRNTLYNHFMANFDPDCVEVNLDRYNKSNQMVYKFMDMVDRGFTSLTILEIADILRDNVMEGCRRLVALRDILESRIPPLTRRAPLTEQEGLELYSVFRRLKNLTMDVLCNIEQNLEISSQAMKYGLKAKLPLDAERLTNRFIYPRFPSFYMDAEKRKQLDVIRQTANVMIAIVNRILVTSRQVDETPLAAPVRGSCETEVGPKDDDVAANNDGPAHETVDDKTCRTLDGDASDENVKPVNDTEKQTQLAPSEGNIFKLLLDSKKSDLQPSAYLHMMVSIEKDDQWFKNEPLYIKHTAELRANGKSILIMDLLNTFHESIEDDMAILRDDILDLLYAVKDNRKSDRDALKKEAISTMKRIISSVNMIKEFSFHVEITEDQIVFVFTKPTQPPVFFNFTSKAARYYEAVELFVENSLIMAQEVRNSW